MKKIWKVKIDLKELNKSEVKIKIPEEHKFINTGVQDYNPVIWFICNTKSKLIEKKIYIRGTGQHFNGHEGSYIGTGHIKLRQPIPYPEMFGIEERYIAVHLFEEKKGLFKRSIKK